MKPHRYCRLLEDYWGAWLAATACIIIMGDPNDGELSLLQKMLHSRKETNKQHIHTHTGGCKSHSRYFLYCVVMYSQKQQCITNLTAVCLTWRGNIAAALKSTPWKIYVVFEILTTKLWGQYINGLIKHEEIINNNTNNVLNSLLLLLWINTNRNTTITYLEQWCWTH